MNKEKKKQNLRQIIKILLLIGVVYLCVILIKDLWELRQASQRVGVFEERLVLMREENENLKKEVEMTETEEFMEKVARDELNMQKEGEVVVIMPDIDLGMMGSVDDDEMKITRNWEKWWRLFF